jgi:hypothetical protein
MKSSGVGFPEVPVEKDIYMVGAGVEAAKAAASRAFQRTVSTPGQK